MDRLQGVCLSPPQALKTPEGTSRGNGWVVLIGYLKKTWAPWLDTWNSRIFSSNPCLQCQCLVKIQLGTCIMVVLEVRKPEKNCGWPEIGGPEANSWSFDRLFLGCLSFKRSFCIVDLRVEMLVKHEHEKTIKNAGGIICVCEFWSALQRWDSNASPFRQWCWLAEGWQLPAFMLNSVLAWIVWGWSHTLQEHARTQWLVPCGSTHKLPQSDNQDFQEVVTNIFLSSPLTCLTIFAVER